jgi:formylglycine-generating enzyme
MGIFALIVPCQSNNFWCIAFAISGNLSFKSLASDKSLRHKMNQENRQNRHAAKLLNALFFSALLLFFSCKNDGQNGDKMVLTPTITVVKDTTVRVAERAQNNAELPKNMLLVKGGFTFVGSDSSGLQVENPRFWIHVQPFFMDISPVTVAEFRQFIKATNYKTEAETFGNAAFIDETSDNAWTLKDGCMWQFPQGKDFPAATDNLPVTQVSWNDATAFAKWAGKRLPHELEYEHAARNARNDQTLYSIGNDLKTPDGKWRVNIWQGIFPDKNLVEDGFKFASPVGFFGKTPIGLTDITGNVWQWCNNGKFDYSDILDALKTNKKWAQSTAEKAQRGGSFLCESRWCHAYRVSGRSFTSPETALMHSGFRCVKDF